MTAAMCVASACSKSTPATPSGASVTASVTVPVPVSPAANATVANSSQPVTLVVQNAAATTGTPSYSFEVATDVNFASKVQTKDGIAQGTSGQTSVRLDALAPGRDYYWRARVISEGTTGAYSVVAKFTVGPAITVDPPGLVAPADGATEGGQVYFTASNAGRGGPVGPLAYKFEISTSSAFSTVLFTATVPEGNGQTRWNPTGLQNNTTYYWRVTAVDTASGAQSAPSVVRRLVTSMIIDLSKVLAAYPGAPSGAELVNWPQTATITVVEQDGNPNGDGPMCIGFTMDRQWPSIPFFGAEEVPVYANQWYFAYINGQWYAGPGEYLRADRTSVCKTGQATDHIGPDGGWYSPMNTWAPKAGELVGYMMSTPARGGMRSINERSNIVVRPWVDSSVRGLTAGGGQ